MNVAEHNDYVGVTASMQSRPPHCRSPNINTCAAAAAPPLCAVCVNLTWCGFDLYSRHMIGLCCLSKTWTSPGVVHVNVVHLFTCTDSWTCPERYLETSSGEVYILQTTEPRGHEDFQAVFSHELCKIVSGHFLEFDFHIWRTGGAAGGRTWRMNPAVQRSVLLFTSSSTRASALIHQKLWNLLVFSKLDVFVFYVFGSSSFILRYLCSSSFTSVTCLCRQHVHSLSVNPLDIHRLYSHMDSPRNFMRRLKGKDPENVQNNLTQTSGLKTEKVMLSQSPLFSHMDSD